MFTPINAALHILMLLVLTAGAQGAELQKGVEAFKRGDYPSVVKEWLPLAEQGNASAQYNLGQLYRRGSGVPQDFAQALGWYKRAADQQHRGAQYALALMYGHGDGIPQDYAESARWAKLAAQQGHKTAQTYLGNFYAQGVGVPQDYVTAYAWFSLAAAQGDKAAAQNLRFVRDRMSPADQGRAQQLSILARSTVGTVDPGAGAKGGTQFYGPVHQGETLWSVAERIKPDPSLSVYQMLHALLEANPKLSGVRTPLKSGLKLKIPDLKQITDTDPETAKAEILGQLSGGAPPATPGIN